jgi:hypothetical protein
LAAALDNPDVRVRARAAETIVRQAVWTRRRSTVDRLAATKHPEVRANAVTGLARLGHHIDAVGFLDDPAPLVRAIARDEARRTGLDPADHYRRTIGGGTFTIATIAGLAETGTPVDSELLRPLLGHELPRVRAAAIRALWSLDPSCAPQLLALLNDPSPAVIREVALALQPIANNLPVDLGWTLLGDATRADRRRAGYHLLAARTPYDHLRAALIATADPDPKLAQRARADATTIVRDATDNTWRGWPRPDLQPSPDQLTELHQLARTATPNEQTSHALKSWLHTLNPLG